MINPHGDAAFELARIEREGKRPIFTVWLKPSRVDVLCPGLRATVLKTNGPDAQICVSLDLDELLGQD